MKCQTPGQAVGLLPAGPREVRWTGRNAGGADVASGVYYARLAFGSETVTRKLVLVR